MAETIQKTQMARYRFSYMKAIIRQDIGWYDVSNPQELSTQFGEAMSTIEKGLGYPAWGMHGRQLDRDKHWLAHLRLHLPAEHLGP